MGPRIGALQRRHKSRVRAILDATEAFRDEEIAIALELFDDPVSYEFVGSFVRGGEGELAGYACYGATPGTDRTYDLYWLAVHPAHQGEGHGTLLLEEVERRLRQREARLLVVETSSKVEYAATRRFYEQRGYAEAARVSDFYTPGDHRVVLTKRIAEEAALISISSNAESARNE